MNSNLLNLPQTWNVLSSGSPHWSGKNRATRRRDVRNHTTRADRQHARAITAIQLRLKLRGETE